MRSKNILSITAFIVAFGFSTALASLFLPIPQIEVSTAVPVNVYKPTGCFKYKNNSSTAAKISALIRQDHLNGQESERAAFQYGTGIYSSSNSQFLGYARATERYVDASSNMKVADLPSDFQVEWREHLKAWREYSEFLNKMKNVSSRKSLTIEELEHIDGFHSREIDRTWNKVLQTGKSYGANTY